MESEFRRSDRFRERTGRTDTTPGWRVVSGLTRQPLPPDHRRRAGHSSVAPPAQPVALTPFPCTASPSSSCWTPSGQGVTAHGMGHARSCTRVEFQSCLTHHPNDRDASCRASPCLSLREVGSRSAHRGRGDTASLAPGSLSFGPLPPSPACQAAPNLVPRLVPGLRRHRNRSVRGAKKCQPRTSLCA